MLGGQTKMSGPSLVFGGAVGGAGAHSEQARVSVSKQKGGPEDFSMSGRVEDTTYSQTTMEKIKRKQDYRKIKDHNVRSGANCRI